jgi:tRNA G37 N-methylase Trm5
MSKFFPLFQSHLDLAHRYWIELLSPGDRVIDATCGNGHDTLALSKMGATIYAMDLQQKALESAKNRLVEEGVAEPVTFIQGCHSKFPEEILNESIKLIVYNLGYLPGGDKEVTTKVMTTLTSIKNAEPLVVPGGAISITCYPGHPEGKREEEQLLDYCHTLDPKQWSCCHHRWINRHLSPSLILLQKEKC